MNLPSITAWRAALLIVVGLIAAGFMAHVWVDLVVMGWRLHELLDQVLQV